MGASCKVKIGNNNNRVVDIIVNELIRFYVNNSTDLHLLTARDMPSYTDEMAIAS